MSKPKTTEMISLNDELFSLEEGNLQVEELEQRLELAIAFLQETSFNCDAFVCGAFESCSGFGCDGFSIIDT